MTTTGREVGAGTDDRAVGHDPHAIGNVGGGSAARSPAASLLWPPRSGREVRLEWRGPWTPSVRQ
jgi:hypothetical protein